jgi:hypothetical protein
MLVAVVPSPRECQRTAQAGSTVNAKTMKGSNVLMQQQQGSALPHGTVTFTSSQVGGKVVFVIKYLMH